MTRRPIALLAVAALLVTAGCMGLSLPGDSGDHPTEATTVPRATYPDPPANLTNETAMQAAIAYEEARLQNQLRNESAVRFFDFGYMRPANATVLNQSDGGVYVEVDARYSYSTDERAADGVPVLSLYHVNESVIRHVAERST